MTARRGTLGPLAALAACGVLAGYVAYLAFVVPWPPLYPAGLESRWIGYGQAPRYSAYFRKEFFFDGVARAAWVKVAAVDQYVVYLNGNALGSNLNAAYSADSFQHRMSEKPQRIGWEENFHFTAVSELSIEGASEWLMASMHDIRRSLQQGRNVLAVEVMSRRPDPRLAIEGRVVNEAGRVVDLGSDVTWRAHALPETREGIGWSSSDFNGLHWRPAIRVSAPGPTSLTFDPALLARPFDAAPVTLAGSAAAELFYRLAFHLEEPVRDGWLRIPNTASYDLFLNGVRVTSWAPPPRRFATLDLHMLSVGPLLRRGRNVLAVHLGPLVNPLIGSSAPVLLLDGLVRSASGREVSMASPGAWRVSSRVGTEWTSKGYDDRSWAPASRVGWLPWQELSAFTPTYRGQVTYWGLGYYVWLGVVALAGAVVVGAGGALAARPLARLAGGERAAGLGLAALCSVAPAALFAAVLLLRIQFGESQAKIPFYAPDLWRMTLGGGLLLLAFSVAVVVLTRHRAAAGGPSVEGKPGRPPFTERAEWLCLGAIVVLASVLRLWALGFQALYVDEAASIEAARGILDTGKPIYVSGVWYTRSALYHYLLAGCLAVFGDTVFAARLPSVVFGVLTVLVVHRLGKTLFRSTGIGLLAALVCAIDPAQLFFSRFVRYYQLLQFFVILTLDYMVRGLIVGWSRRLQILALASFVCAMLTAEIVMTIFPALLVGYLIFAPPFRWREQKHLVVGAVIIGLVLVLDMAVYINRTLTPFAGIGESARSTLHVHLLQLVGFPLVFLVGHMRIHLIYSLLALIGLALWLRRRQWPVLYLYLIVALTLVVQSLLLPQKSSRYTYSINPLLFLLAVGSAVELAVRAPLARWATTPALARAGKAIAGLCAVVLAVALVLAMHPVRVLRSSETRTMVDNAAAAEFVDRHRRPGDLVIHTSPLHGLARRLAMDYFVPSDLAFEYYYRRDGRVVDRASGVEMVINPDKVRQILDASERVWILVDITRWNNSRSPANQQFLLENTEVVFENYFSRVLLWDRSRGRFQPGPGHGGERGLY